MIALQQDFLLDEPGRLAWHAYRDAACDFVLVDGDGHEITVEVSGAELFFRRRETGKWLADREVQRALALAPPGRDAKRVNRAQVAEGVLGHGRPVEVLGVLGRAIDPQAETGYRDAPTRPVIQSGKTPLVLFGAG